jgi:hypothetical protein
VALIHRHYPTAIARKCHNVEAIQCVQEEVSWVTVRVVPGPEFSEVDRVALSAAIARRLGDEIEATIQTVPEVERTAGDKFPSIVSKIPVDKGQLF